MHAGTCVLCCERRINIYSECEIVLGGVRLCTRARTCYLNGRPRARGTGAHELAARGPEPREVLMREGERFDTVVLEAAHGGAARGTLYTFVPEEPDDDVPRGPLSR